MFASLVRESLTLAGTNACREQWAGWEDMNSWKSRLIACNHRSSCYGIAWAPCRKSEKVTSCFRQCAQRLDKIVVSAVNGSKLWTWCPSTLHRCKVLQRHVETILIPCVSCYFLVQPLHDVSYNHCFWCGTSVHNSNSGSHIGSWHRRRNWKRLRWKQRRKAHSRQSDDRCTKRWRYWRFEALAYYKQYD